MNETHAIVEPVRKTLNVRCSPERAFEVFTREIASWWPFGTHSIGKAETTEVVFEERVGGRVFERQAGGAEADWGEVVAWEPPSRLVMTWHPGGDPSEATELEVRFSADGDGTRVELEHRGWEIFAERAEESRSNYDGGWETVLGRFVHHFD